MLGGPSSRFERGRHRVQTFDVDTISAQDIVDTVSEGLVVLDRDLAVVSANRRFYELFAVTPEETIGRRLTALGDGQWDIPELRRLLEADAPDPSRPPRLSAGSPTPGRRTGAPTARCSDQSQAQAPAPE
ncbi:PAS domain-containing protein [Consotaella aegiceratis]|uniref:PAS domain-containing protein n=1 Tax=Consotaella aegiceratis TaxID=3097961 RepID=UPI002F3F1D88